MKYSFIILLLILTASVVSAQEVVSCNGDSKSGAGVEVSWTVGEAVIATFTDGSNNLTQGFHQTRLTITAISEVLFPGLEIKVFPNPTADIIMIQFSEFIDGARYWLYDMSGRVLENKLINAMDTEINMKRYASGQYILKLTSESRQAIQTFQIIKY